MMSDFYRRNGIKPFFEYHYYLREVMGRACVEFMGIHWASWAVLLSFGALMTLFQMVFHQNAIGDRSGTATFEQYAFFVITLSLSILAAHVGIFFSARRAFKRMIEAVKRVGSEGVLGAEDMPPEGWDERIMWFLQVTSLFNSFAIAFYFLSGRHILAGYGQNPSRLLASEESSSDYYVETGMHYHFIVLAPALFNCLYLLPKTLPLVFLVKGYLCLDKAALSSIIEEAEELAEDMSIMYEFWKKSGSPGANKFDKAAGGDGLIDRSEFPHVLQELGMSTSAKRMERVFKTLDVDGSGELHVVEEFLAALMKIDEAGGEPHAVKLGQRAIGETFGNTRAKE